jgi:hypothetical protein
MKKTTVSKNTPATPLAGSGGTAIPVTAIVATINTSAKDEATYRRLGRTRHKR